MKILLDDAERDWLIILGIVLSMGGVIYYINSLTTYQAIVTDDVIGNSTFQDCETSRIRSCDYYKPTFNIQPQSFNHFLSKPTKCCEPANDTTGVYVVKYVWNSGLKGAEIRELVKSYNRAHRNRDVCHLVS